MKTAKKVLSVVIAIAMALSCFAVAASAYGPKDATYQAKWWLTADVSDFAWASKTKSNLADFAEPIEPDPDDPEYGNHFYKKDIYVEAGSVVGIRTHLSTNYYPQEVQFTMFYSKELRTTYEMYQDKYGDPTSANFKKTANFWVVNPHNTYMYTSGANDSLASNTFTFPEKMANTANLAMWPRLSSDGESTLSMEDYKPMYLSWLHGASVGSEENYILSYDDPEYFVHPDEYDEEMVYNPDDFSWLFYVPFQVPATAEDGDVFYVTIPAETQRRAELPDGVNIVTMCGDQQYEVTTKASVAWSADQAMDFSEATIAIHVGEAPEEDELDYTALEDAIADFEALTETDWTADSWADAEAAYDDATALIDNAETQDEIDEAAEALNDAITALVEAGPDLDFTELEAAIGKTPDDLSAYTTSSADAVVAAWSDAMFARSADNQDDIDAAADALNDAIDALKLKVDTTELAAALAAAGAVEDIDDWYEISADELADAVAAGEALMANADDTSVDAQGTFDDAADAINDILANHSYSVADYSRVWELQDQVATLKEADYTAASWAALETALDAVVPGLLKSKQGQVDEMAENIELAIDGLKELADTSRLERAVADAANANEADYAADVWTQIQNDVADADNYIGKGLAADDFQGDIDALTDDLNDALINMLTAADYADVNIAVNKMPDDFSLYTDETTQAVLDAYSAIDWTLKSDKQAQVDKMAADLEDAIDKLAYKPANLSALAAAIEQAQAIDEDLVSADSYARLQDALEAAELARANANDIRNQDDVDTAAQAVTDAIALLEWLGADYSALNQAKADFEALDEDLYTVDSYAAAATAYDAATKVAANLSKAEQATIDDAAAALSNAINDLAFAACDYTALDAAKTAATLSNFYSNSTMPKYKDDLWTAYSEAKTAAEAIPAGLTKENNNQATIDAAAAALADATAALKLDSAYNAYDYTATNEIADVYNNPANADNYTTASWQAFAEKVEALNMDYTMKAADYGKATTQYNNLKKAYEALVPAAAADYTAVDAAIASFNNYNENEYTAESWKAVEDAIANVTTGLNENHQDEVDAMAAAINEAIDNLVKAAAPIDYTALENVYNYLKDTDLTNCVVGKDAFETALANAADMLDAKNAETQSQVNALATAITTAFANLKFGADYSVLEDLIASAEKLNEADWTAESWANLEAALADAKAVPADLTTDDQATIDDAAYAISLARENLQKYVAPVVPADYKALNSAKLQAAQKDEALYTAESWAVLEAALAEAEKIAADLTADDQAIIDAATEAINDAIAGLETKAPVEGGTVKEVEYATPTKDTHNTFTITVEGRPSFIQFVEYDYGNGTRSFDRYNENASIVSYDKDGNVVDSRSADLAYEVWTIYSNLGEGETGVRAKYGKVWEDLGEAYTFTYAVDRSAAGLISAELAATSGEKTGPVATTIVTGPDVEYVQLKMDDGSTCTYAASKAVANDDGTLTFSGYSWANHEGANVITVRILAANKWTDATTLTYTVGSEEQIINLPEEFVW